ncbi:hypothetical protein BX666DRAFT_2024928 [Dichotomocladium elegans]|nr:hypothetical protein BX666DRAFT_2024928 [Dichotomocladium elegans]
MLKYMNSQHDDGVAFPPDGPAPPQVQPEEIGGSAMLSKSRYDGSSWGGHEAGGGDSSRACVSTRSSSSSSDHPGGWDTMHQERDMPSSSSSWRAFDAIAQQGEKQRTSASAQQKAFPSTPPLSPSSSVVSDMLNRSSSSSFADTTSFARGKTTMVAGATKPAMPFVSGDVNFVTGPPIIPRSRTPPPQDHHQQMLSEESARHQQRRLKSIFDSDDDDNNGNDGNDVTDVDFELFFKEFSTHPPKPKRHSNHRKSIKVRRMSKFNLMAFANHLHQNRLSVMQLRESRILLTGEDELELTRLLEQRKSMMPGPGAPPLMPPLPPPSANLPPLPSLSDFEGGNGQKSSDHSEFRSEAASAEATSKSSPPVVVVSDELCKTDGMPITTLSKKASRRRQVVRKSMSMDEIRRGIASRQDKDHSGDMDTIQEDTATTWASEKVEEEKTDEQQKMSQQIQSPSAPATIAPEPSVSTSYLKSKFELGSGTRAKAIGLFGSLRHATSRSTPFKGLVRNLSSASLSARYSQGAKAAAAAATAAIQRKDKDKESDQEQQQQQQPEDRSRHRLFHNKKKSRGDLEETGSTMSPAAQAVMQLDKKKEKKNKKAADAATTIHEHTPSKGGLLTHLLAKAGKARRTKAVNMTSKRKDKTKSRVVRRTIIYVPPDSLNFAGNPNDANHTVRGNKNNSSSNSISGKQTQPMPTDMSEKLRLHRIETSEAEDNGAEANYYDDESLYDYYRSRESSVATPQLEGLELRELEDGTVEWGIVKKQGNRKSFYAHGQDSYTEEDDDDGDEEHVLKMMGLSVPSTLSLTSASSPPPPLPRRSPRRRLDSEHDRVAEHISTITSPDASTTDVYYAPQQTLPDLLRMIADQEKKEEEDEEAYLDERRKKQASVEEQLDDMMRSFQPVDYK